MKVPGNVEKLTWSTGDTTLSCLLIFCLIDTPQTTNEREHETSFSNCWLPFTLQQQNGCSSEHHNMKTCRNKNMDTGRIQLCSNFKFELWLQFWFFFPSHYFSPCHQTSQLSTVIRPAFSYMSRFFWSQWHIRVCLDYTFLEQTNRCGSQIKPCNFIEPLV